MAIYNKRVVFNREKLIHISQRRDSLTDFIYGIIRFLSIIIQNIYCVSSYLVLSWIVLFPISWIRSDLYSKAENYLYNSLLFIVSSWSAAAGITVVETGEELKDLIDGSEKYSTHCESSPRLKGESELSNDCINGFESNENYELRHSGDRAQKSNAHVHHFDEPRHITNITRTKKPFLKRDSLVIPPSLKDDLTPNGIVTKADHTKTKVLLLCNHISTADVPLIMQVFSTLTNQSILWVLDALFKPTNFGLVCSSHGDFFVAKNSFIDGSLRDQALKHPDRNLLVLFPEGGFWRKRLEGSNRYALRNGLPMTQYVTHPRFGAFKDLIDPSVDVTHIVDATLFYDDMKNPLSILDIVLGTRKEAVFLNYKIYKRSEINPTEEWLRNIWLEKDKLLKQYYEDREKVLESFEGNMRTVKLDWFKVLSVHIFYLLVCYLTIYRLFSATSVTMLKARDLYYSNI